MNLPDPKFIADVAAGVSGLAVTATFVALHYDKKALKSLGRVMNTGGTRILHGVVEKMSQRFQQKFGLNEFSPEGREKVTSAMIGDWIRLGKNDATRKRWSW